MTALLPEYSPAAVDDAVLSIEGADFLADGWAARLVPTGSVPTHTRACWLAEYGFDAETCACTATAEPLRQRHADHLRHHPH